MEDDLKTIRELMARVGCQSWTSEKYQNDIYSFVLKNQTLGRGIVEVGCYKGGLSTFLAFVCKKLSWPFYTIDINQQFVGETRKLLDGLGLADQVTFFDGTLRQFASKVKLDTSPLLVVVDGAHEYKGVLDDIRSIYQLNRQSHSAVFHDFSLRHDDMLDERVDKAILDFFGEEIALQRIGEQFGENTTYPLKSRPSEDGHYWELNGSEGVIIKLPPNPKGNQLGQKMGDWWKNLWGEHDLRKYAAPKN
jgi:hypothetical protein